MLGGYSQQFYVLFALVTAGYLTLSGTKRYRITTFIIAFWILGGSIIHLSAYNLPFRMIGGEMQIKRLAFLIISMYLIFIYFLKPGYKESLMKIHYEKYFYALILWFLIVIGYHFFNGLFQKREVIGIIEAMLIVLVVYLTVKRTGDAEILRVLGRAIIIVAVVSSLVAIIQFFGNPWFMRIGGALPAFGGKLRSNGIFHTEYTHSYVTLSALIVTLVAFKPGKIKQIISILLFIGIIMSFHRMSWLLTFLILTGYFALYRRESLKLIILLVPFVISIILFFALELFPVIDYLEGTSFYSERLTANTWETRQKLNEMVFQQFDKIALVGAGSTKSPLYYYSIIDAGMGEEWATGMRGGFHNLYFYYLFVYGLPFVLLFIFLLVSGLRYYFQLVMEKKYFFLIAVLFLIMFIIMNISNSFPLEADFGFFVGLFLGANAAVVSRSHNLLKEFMPYVQDSR